MTKVIKKKDLLNEVLGVPRSIIRLANEIFNDIIYQIKDNDDYNSLNNKEIKVRLINSYIGSNSQGEKGTKYNGALIKLEIKNSNQVDKITFDGASAPVYIQPDIINIKLEFIFPISTTGKDFKKHLLDNAAYYIGTLGHEAKHEYDYTKSPSLFGKDAKYYMLRQKDTDYFNNAQKDFKDGRIDEQMKNMFNLFHFIFYSLYYTHTVESLVRPTQVFADMERRGIKKKDFLNYLSSNQEVKGLKKMKGLSYEIFSDKIKTYLLKHQELENNKISNDSNLNQYELKNFKDRYLDSTFRYWCDTLFNMYMENINERYKSFLLYNELAKYSNQETLKNALDSFQNEIKKLYSNNGETFFKKTIKMIQEKSENNLRKISKLYALAKDDYEYMNKYPKAFQKPSYQQSIYNPKYKL
jgi:hypothetical protein